MTFTAFALIILAGLIHACWNIVAKKAGGDSRFAFFTSVIMMIVWAPLGWYLGRDAVPLWGAVADAGKFLPGDAIKVVVTALVAKQVHRAYPGLIPQRRPSRATADRSTEPV